MLSLDIVIPAQGAPSAWHCQLLLGCKQITVLHVAGFWIVQLAESVPTTQPFNTRPAGYLTMDASFSIATLKD
jgi:hypothetical protein